jgi:ABC-2 type transport system ATP-binding protein
MAPLLEIRNLGKHYEDFTLGPVSLGIPEGCIVGVFGPSGAGKTTLVKLAAGQIPADSGEVRVFGLDYADCAKQIKNSIGYVPQEPSFYWNKTVGWTARFASHFFAGWDSPLFYRLADEFRVNRLSKVKNLSRGRKTLLSLALALAHHPDLFLLDEPTAGLDMVLRREILARLRHLVAEGQRSVVISSHFTDGLDDICDYIYFLNEGRLILHAAKDELLSRWKWVRFKEGSLPQEILDQLISVEKHPFHTSGLTRDFPGLKERLAEAQAASEVMVENARLDDILIALLKGAQHAAPFET